MLGIVFLFALAASRGWIGPAVRCSIGGGVSALLVGAALVARQRFGQVAAALAAAGAGIGGFYVTLYAASRGYHLLGTGFVWAAVVVVAGLAAAMALAWSSELLAVLGLVAVVAAPPVVEGKLTGLGLGASVLAAAVALGLGQERRWRVLGGLAFGLTLAQVAVYVVDSRWHSLDDLGRFHVEWEHRGTAGLLACAVLALALAGAAAYQRRSGQLDWFAAALASVSLPFALLSVWALVHGTDGRGTALLGLAAVYAASAVAFSRLPGEARHFADLPVALSLFAVALATATYLSDGGLLTAWTLEGLALTALAVRSGRKGYQAAGLAYFAAAGAHLFAFEVPLTHLFSQRLHPAQHIVELLLMVASLAVAALLLRGRELLFPRLDLAAAATAGLLGLYAASLGVLQASQELGGADCTRASSAVRRWSPRSGRSRRSRCCMPASHGGARNCAATASRSWASRSRSCSCSTSPNSPRSPGRAASSPSGWRCWPAACSFSA